MLINFWSNYLLFLNFFVLRFTLYTDDRMRHSHITLESLKLINIWRFENGEAGDARQ